MKELVKEDKSATEHTTILSVSNSTEELIDNPGDSMLKDMTVRP